LEILSNNCGKIEVRQAVMSDIELLVTICQQSFHGTLLWNGPRFISRNWWRSVLKYSFAETWIFSIDNEPSGFCVFILDIKKWWAELPYVERSKAVRLCAAALCPKLVLSRLLDKLLVKRPLLSVCPKSECVAKATGARTRIRLLAVAPQNRRRGIGVKILQFCENRTIEIGCKIIELTVFNEHTSARSLYLKHGYVCTNHKHNRCVFTKVLGAS
jgi:GNAT superfamily N-acetyltransferase